MMPLRPQVRMRRASEWHEDHGPALWFDAPGEPASYVGGPLDSDWPSFWPVDAHAEGDVDWPRWVPHPNVTDEEEPSRGLDRDRLLGLLALTYWAMCERESWEKPGPTQSEAFDGVRDVLANEDLDPHVNEREYKRAVDRCREEMGF